jgi:hypothetical protein
MPFVGSERGVHFYITRVDRFTWTERLRLGVAESVEPACDRRGREDRNIPAQAAEGIERKVVRMCVGNENRVDIGKLVKRNTRRADTSEQPAQRRVEIGVGEKSPTPELN